MTEESAAVRRHFEGMLARFLESERGRPVILPPVLMPGDRFRGAPALEDAPPASIVLTGWKFAQREAAPEEGDAWARTLWRDRLSGAAWRAVPWPPKIAP